MSSQYSYNRLHLIRDGKPWLPTMGEFHYARYPRDEWRMEIDKMKACGVDIVATYVFWIHHEYEEGIFDFSGQRDLKSFLQTCADAGVDVWLRIGPWCHGECRHGGFPEWLMKKPFPLRDDNEAYMTLVRRFWQQVYQQSKEALYDHGGPIIGIQIENEFGHCGGSGENAHMDHLLKLANEIGLKAPLYTATGWGGAQIGTKLLPVMGCYCDAPWDRSLAPLPPSPNYLFSHERNDVDVGSDFERGAHVTFDEDAYPYLLAEMGGGIGCTFQRRPTATPADTAAMALTKLGSGANLLGYYMYHGGTNPGPNLNETRESGSYCDTPTLAYQPHSPIGEYGQVDELARELKLLSLFIHDYGEWLAPLPAQLPENGAMHPTDMESPRYALRTRDGCGFLFINNHQRSLTLPERTIDIPDIGHYAVPSGYYAVLPLNLPLGSSAILRRANASPLCILNNRTYVFYCDGDPAYQLDGEAEIITLSRREALDAWRITNSDGSETLAICESPVISTPEGLRILTRKTVDWRTLDGRHGTAAIPESSPKVTCKRINENVQCYDYDLTFLYDGDADTFLKVLYEGSLAELFVNGQKVADNLYDGSLWEVKLNRFGKPASAVLRIYALFEGMPVWLQNPPVFTDGRALRLQSIELENEYSIPL